MQNQDPNGVEAQIVLSKNQKFSNTTSRELLTVREMLARNFPQEKIDAICARGGVPDPDVPHLPQCMRFWVQTSCVAQDSEEVSQTSTMQIAAQPSAAGVDAVMSGPNPVQQTMLPQGGMEQIMASMQQEQSSGEIDVAYIGSATMTTDTLQSTFCFTAICGNRPLASLPYVAFFYSQDWIFDHFDPSMHMHRHIHICMNI